ncbi:MAG TPA: acetoacetate decarboxylase family protein [Solirubrobacterales bacterium]|nr:acetoacetate decarboxylase family protein [Solirubrobacterales bacterium]
MGFVKSAAEIREIQAALARPRFVNSQMIVVTFLTREETVAEILPPGFEPTAEPRVTAQLGTWQSNCCGDFNGGAVTIAARYGELEGEYALCMYMDNDQPTLYGRDLFGEPKKIATASIFTTPTGYRGYIERRGVRLVELEVEGAEDVGPARVSANNFNIKARPAADGVGLQEDALVTCAVFENDIRANHEGTGKVRLRGTRHDPLDEIEVVEVLSGRQIEVDMEARTSVVGTIPAADYEPYFYGRGADDWSALDTSGGSLPVSA